MANRQHIRPSKHAKIASQRASAQPFGVPPLNKARIKISKRKREEVNTL